MSARMSPPSLGRVAPAAGRAHGWLTTPVVTGYRDTFVAIGLAVVFTVVLLATVDGIGYARDEGFYFNAARAYQRWFELLFHDPGQALARVDEHWRVNSEHPALVKSLFAASHHFLFERFKLFSVEGTSFRFPAMALSGVGVGLVYLWGTRARGRLIGVVAAVSLAAMPRFFFHAHLACFDAPVVAMWTACAYAYWRAMERGGPWWPLVAGITFGLALDTKHNAWFLPFVCGGHAILLVAFAGRARRRGVARRALAVLGAMALLGPALFYALWPWLWHDTAARLAAYARFHLDHVYYNMEFLGRNYWQPPMPRGYAWLMTAATVPSVTLVAFAAGLGASLRDYLRVSGAALASSFARALRRGAARARRTVVDESAQPGLRPTNQPLLESPSTALLWLLATAIQYAAWLSPATPIFGGTKHWMTAYPFVALFAGTGVAALARLARHLQRRPSGGRVPLVELAIGASALAAPTVEAMHARRFGLTSYTPLVGGAAGAANLGLNRGFWGYTTAAVAAHLDEVAPPRGRVFLHDTAWPAWEMLQRDGVVRRDLVGVSDAGASDVTLYHHELHMSGVEYQSWVAFGTVAPDEIEGLDGVPVIWLYRRP